MLNKLTYYNYTFSSHKLCEIRSVFLKIILLVCGATQLIAQENLVPNPSFEEYWECPTAPGSVGDNQLEKCKHWWKPSSATTDYYNGCQADESLGVSVPNNWFGHQFAYDGDAYVGIIVFDESGPSMSEYVQCRLTKPLQSCKTYLVTFYASLGDYSHRKSPTLGLRLDVDSIHMQNPFQFHAFDLPAHITSQGTISDTINWVKLQGYYMASGGERFLTIGRFIDTNLYSNDDPPAEINNCQTCNDFVLPCQYYIDMVSVVETATDLTNEIANVFTANFDGVNDYWYPTGTCLNNWTCTILNRWGEVVYEFKEGDAGWNGNAASGVTLSEGVYYYQLTNQTEKQTGFIHLVR